MMKYKTYTLVAALALGLTAQADILIDATTLNGSFELPTAGKLADGFDGATDIPAWQNVGVTYGDTGVQAGGDATDGSYFAFFLSSDDAAYNLTDYVMEENDQFTLTWDARRSGSAGEQLVTLFSSTSGDYSTAATLVSTTDPALASGMTQYTLNYTAVAADAGKTIGITFDNTAASAQWISADNFQLEVIPEPATLGLLGVAGGMLLLIRRKFMM